MNIAETSVKSPTIIEIKSQGPAYVSDETSPYFDRVVLDAKIASTARFDRVNFTHLGFQAWRLGNSRIHMRGDRHTVLVSLDVCGAAQAEIKPFRISLENIGDSLIKVSIRMRGGMERCKILLLQEGYQAKEPKIIDDFVKYRDIWYATTIINSLQSIRIEEES